jgi:lipopolysaccharide/colanic/teichoic acid biosynthesis glycosyltransferase
VVSTLPGLLTGRSAASELPRRRAHVGIPATPGRYAEGARRLLNIAVAAAALIVLAPVMALIALTIRLTSRGPIIYTQTRIGLDRRRPLDISYDGRRKVDLGGRPFTIFKFRTMRADPAAALQVWAKPNDSRVTAIGRILRKTRLDELPQLFNVLRGDMNIVGPRPEQPSIFMSLRQEIHRYPERQQVLPGITGWAQVNQQYDTCLDDVKSKVAYDLEYIHTRSVLGDLRILLRTIPVMFFRRGAW